MRKQSIFIIKQHCTIQLFDFIFILLPITVEQIKRMDNETKERYCYHVGIKVFHLLSSF